jgi:hypothetical protein
VYADVCLIFCASNKNTKLAKHQNTKEKRKQATRTMDTMLTSFKQHIVEPNNL